MTSRERVINAITFQPVDKIPLDVEYGITEYENDILTPRYSYGSGKTSGEYGVKGRRTDYWGSEWESAEDGVKGEVKRPLLESLKQNQLNKLYIPYDVLDQADLSKVIEDYEASYKFTSYGGNCSSRFIKSTVTLQKSMVNM